MTAADFYLGRGEDARWIGSLSHHADPTALASIPHGPDILNAVSASAFACAVDSLLADAQAGDVHSPGDGWPWRWPDSALTGWCYAFDTGRVWISYFGRAWFVCPAVDRDDFDTVLDGLRRSSTDGPRADFPAQHSSRPSTSDRPQFTSSREISFWELHGLLEQAARDTRDPDTALCGWTEMEPPELFIGDEPYSLLAHVLHALGVRGAKVHALGINDRAPSQVFARLGCRLTRNARELADEFWFWELREEWWADLLADHARPTYPQDLDAHPMPAKVATV